MHAKREQRVERGKERERERERERESEREEREERERPVTPLGANSLAMALVIPSTPPLAAE